jgi:hypothetical protein
MECFLVFYANDTGTQLGARHQNVPFKSNVFVILVVPAFPVEFSWYRGAAKDDGILEYVFEESTCASSARRTYPQLRTLFYDIGGGTQSEMRGLSGAVAQKSDPGRVQPRSRDFAREPESP